MNFSWNLFSEMCWLIFFLSALRDVNNWCLVACLLDYMLLWSMVLLSVKLNYVVGDDVVIESRWISCEHVTIYFAWLWHSWNLYDIHMIARLYYVEHRALYMSMGVGVILSLYVLFETIVSYFCYKYDEKYLGLQPFPDQDLYH